MNALPLRPGALPPLPRLRLRRPPVRWLALGVLYTAALVLVTLCRGLRGARPRAAARRGRPPVACRKLRRSVERTIAALGCAIAAKDAATGDHLRRVASYAVEVGRRLGMGAADLELLEVAALLHDVGKIAIPEAILGKPRPLDPDEVAWMQRHPEIGARMLEDLDGLAEAAPLVRHHQERYDGRRDGRYPGYPAGLRGEEIPLGARIIAVVDAFDAMISDRSYWPALAAAEAVATLYDERGRQFDPAVVDAFLDLLEERPWRPGSTAAPAYGSATHE